MNFKKYENKLPYPDPRMKLADARKMNLAYREETQRLKDLFKADLLEEHGVTNNPKADKCFELAWSEGHSAGFSEVASYFEEFVELIK